MRFYLVRFYSAAVVHIIKLAQQQFSTQSYHLQTGRHFTRCDVRDGRRVETYIISSWVGIG